MKQIKFATIGSSLITEQFIAGTKLNNKMVHTAIYSRTAEKGAEFSAKHGNLPVYTSLEELGKSDVDAVYIASPNKFHYEQSKMMLNMGKHVICEKSVSAHPHEVKELQEIADKNGLIFIEAMMFMHLPQKEILADALSKIGSIQTATLNFCQRSSRYDAYLQGNIHNIFKAECETGALLDLGIYCVYPAVYFFGVPEETFSASTLLTTGVDGTGSIIMKYPDKIITLKYSKTCQSAVPSEFLGDQGAVTLDSISMLSNITLHDRNGNVTQLWEGEDKPHLMSHEAADFADFINDPDGTREYYKLCNDISYEVSKIMYKTRMQGNVIYPSDK